MPKNAESGTPDKSKSADENNGVKVLRAEVSSYLAKIIVAAAAGIIGIAGLGIWIYVKTLLPGIVGGVPQGAVLAFDLPSGCPAGWSPFGRGVSRVLVGSSEYHGSPVLNVDKNGQPLTSRPYQSDGGEEKHLLTLDEMPAHDHGFNIAQSNEFLRENGNHFQGTISVGRDAQRMDPRQPIKFTEIAGGGKSFNVMPPFLALPFCKKD
jgi:hypothetical protein